MQAANARIQCENRVMQSLPRALIFSFFCFPVLLGMSQPAKAQEANVLGLPAVPQPKGGVASAPRGAASKPATTVPNRDVLSGELGLQHSALGGVGRLIVTTRTIFETAGAKSNALDAAKAVQRELIASCGKQCKPEKMAAPKILPGGQLEFELAFRPLYQHLSQAQFVAALQSKPMNLTPAQLNAPSVAGPSADPAAK